jgi:ATP-dependent DNA helicase RecG
MLKFISKSVKEVSFSQNVGVNVGINETDILRLINENPKISANAMAEKLQMTSRQVERLLAEMKRKKIIERIGPNKGGEWKVSF